MRYWFILILLCIGAPLSGQDTIPTENGTKEVVTPKKGDAVKTNAVFKSGDSTYDNAPLVNYNFVEPRSYVIKDIDIKEIN